MALDPAKDDSVYDFLYIDSLRIALFLSQFSQYGHLTALTRSANETEASSGGFNVHIAKVETASTAQTAQSKQFDTQWVAPLTFLDETYQRGMISRDLDRARIGRLALVTGDLAVFDLGVIQSAWGLEHVRSMLRAAAALSSPAPANRQEKRRTEKAGSSGSSEMDAGLELLRTFPHAILATVNTNTQSVWSSLKSDGLIIPASDLMIKHGVDIAGQWNMLGVVDALPDTSDTDTDARTYRAANSLGSLGTVIAGVAPAVRGMLGRPTEAFGMTPLLIFRKIAG